MPKTVIEQAIRGVLASIPGVGKVGESHLKRAVQHALTASGFNVDVEDGREFLKPGMPAWRSRTTNAVELPRGRLRIDLVIYRSGTPVALIETESDLDDLRANGTSKRNGHYDVFSIAQSSDSRFFDSYKSLERMAAAVYYWDRSRRTGAYPSVAEGEALLTKIQSSSPDDHNPSHFPMFLVTGRCRRSDPGILDARLRSLGAVMLPRDSRSTPLDVTVRH